MSLPSCAVYEPDELVLSKQFNVCADVPKGSTSEIEKPVDVEFVDARIGNAHVRYIFDNYPRKKTITEGDEDVSPIISGDLGMRLIEHGKTMDQDEYAYIRFDQAQGGKYPYAYAEVMSSDARDKEFMKLVAMMRRCRSNSR